MPAQKTKKKLLLVVTKSNWGGAQKYVYDLAAHAKDKYETMVILGGEGELKQKLESVKVRAISLSSLSRNINIINDSIVFFELLRIFKKERPDIVHLNSSKIGIIGALAARFAKIPRIVFTAHGWAFNEKRSWISKILFRLLHWFTIILSHKTILVSRALSQDISPMPFIRKKLTVIHNGVKTFPLKTRDEARAVLLPEKTRAALSKTTTWFGTIAELHDNKGLLYAIEAIKKLKDFSPNTDFLFVVVGEGEERKRLEDSIARFNLKETIFLVGHRENAATFLSAFDIFISSSTTEALGIAILEAGLAGLPVISSSVGGVPEIIDDMKSGILIRSKNPDEIAKAFGYALSHKKEVTEFGKKLRLNVKKRFSFTKMLQETFSMYE